MSCEIEVNICGLSLPLFHFLPQESSSFSFPSPTSYLVLLTLSVFVVYVLALLKTIESMKPSGIFTLWCHGAVNAEALGTIEDEAWLHRRQCLREGAEVHRQVRQAVQREVGLCKTVWPPAHPRQYGAHAVTKSATGGAPFLSLYALQVTGSWLRVAQTWIRQDCLPVMSYRRGRPSVLNTFFKKLITKNKKNKS